MGEHQPPLSKRFMQRRSERLANEKIARDFDKQCERLFFRGLFRHDEQMQNNALALARIYDAYLRY